MSTATAAHVRVHPDIRVRIPSACQSERTASLVGIVVHDTEGHNLPHSIADLEGLGHVFAPLAAKRSAHVGTDADGFSARFVPDTRKAWHCASYNSATLGIEQIGLASQLEWPLLQLQETARWIALWHRRHGIPIQRGAVAGGRFTLPGVVTHAQLGQLGGGHTDPGTHYPLDRVLELARGFAKAHH